MEWIKYSDQIPGHDEWVLAYNGSDIFLLKFERNMDKRYKVKTGRFQTSEDQYFDQITHWMSLPHPKE